MSFLEHIQEFGTVESTMATALQAAQNGASQGATIVAKEQTAGRGRRGRDWHSPNGGGLFATTVLYPEKGREKVHQLSLVAGVAIHRALSSLGATEAQLKWPNDILVNGKKLCGVLLECVPHEAAHIAGGQIVLVGYGVNLQRAAQAGLPEELTSQYVGLGDLIANQPTARSSCETILKELEVGVLEWSTQGLATTIAYWDTADSLAGKTVQAQSATGPISGVARGLDAEGRLILETAGKTHAIDSGEVFEVREHAKSF